MSICPRVAKPGAARLPAGQVKGLFHSTSLGARRSYSEGERQRVRKSHCLTCFYFSLKVVQRTARCIVLCIDGIMKDTLHLRHITG